MSADRDTIILAVKGLCYVCIGVFTPWSAALAQWINSGDWPSRIVWVAVILPASVVGGASQLLAFLNSSYANYVNARGSSDTAGPGADRVSTTNADTK